MSWESRMEANRQEVEDHHINREKFLENEIRDKDSDFYVFSEISLIECVPSASDDEIAEMKLLCESKNYSGIGRLMIKIIYASAKAEAEIRL